MVTRFVDVLRSAGSPYPVWVEGPGHHLGVEGGRLVVRAGSRRVMSIALTLVGEVVLSGGASASAAALRALLRVGVPVALVGERGCPGGRLEPAGADGPYWRALQLTAVLDRERTLEVARSLVAAKIHNAATLLGRWDRRSSSTLAVSVRSDAERAGRARDLPSLLGIEGIAARRYYRAVRQQVTGVSGFAGRDRRSSDALNVLTNYLSAVVTSLALDSVVAAGLDPSVSFLHTPQRGRPTLAFDLVEPLRPVLIDATAVALVRLRAVQDTDVVRTEEGPRLLDHARGAALRRLQSRLDSPAPGAFGTYRTVVRRQAVELRAALASGETPRWYRWR